MSPIDLPLFGGGDGLGSIVPRAEGTITLSVGGIAAIVLGVVIFVENVLLFYLHRRNQSGSGARRMW